VEKLKNTMTPKSVKLFNVAPMYIFSFYSFKLILMLKPPLKELSLTLLVFNHAFLTCTLSVKDTLFLRKAH